MGAIFARAVSGRVRSGPDRARALRTAGIRGEVAARSKIQRPAGERVISDARRRDALGPTRTRCILNTGFCSDERVGPCPIRVGLGETQRRYVLGFWQDGYRPERLTRKEAAVLARCSGDAIRNTVAGHRCEERTSGRGVVQVLVADLRRVA